MKWGSLFGYLCEASVYQLKINHSLSTNISAMVVSKASRAQRTRRKNELKSKAKAKEPQPFKNKPPRPTYMIEENIDPLLRDDCSDVILLETNDESRDKAGIIEDYDKEVSLINESQQILECC